MSNPPWQCQQPSSQASARHRRTGRSRAPAARRSGGGRRRGRNQNCLGSVNPMTRRRRRLARRQASRLAKAVDAPRRSKLAVGEQQPRTLRSVPLRSSRRHKGDVVLMRRAAPQTMFCRSPGDGDGEQHLGHLPRRSSGWRRVSAVYIGPPPVLQARRRHDPYCARLGTRRGIPADALLARFGCDAMSKHERAPTEAGVRLVHPIAPRRRVHYARSALPGSCRRR